DIPILPSTEVNRGDLLTLVGRTQDVAAATKMLGVADRLTDVTDMAFVGAAIVVGALIGALVFKVAGVPLTLSTAGGALIAGIIGGWLRSVRPSFGRIPTPTVWFMNSVGLNIFIAIVGISAGPGFVNGLKTQGIGLFLWGCENQRTTSSSQSPIIRYRETERVRQTRSVRDQGFCPKSGIENGAGKFPVVPERRSWQPKLGRH